MHQLRQELRGLLRALIEVARQDGPMTGAELGVLLSFAEGWALVHVGESLDHDLAAQRAAFLRRHLEAMAALNALPDGRVRASDRPLLRTLSAAASG